MTLFTDQAAAVLDLQQNRLLSVARTYWPGVTLDGDYLFSKLLSAEAYIERKLRLFVEPVEMLPEGATQAERDAFDNTDPPVRWAEEPGYDLDPGFFHGNSWGFIPTRHRPIIAVHSIRFVYPQPVTAVFEIPADWIRLDRKYGQIRMVPGTQAFTAPLSAWIMQVLGGGRSIPHMIQVRYSAGLSDVPTQHPDLFDLIKKQAVLSIIEDAYLPQSVSQSIDGMSQSLSVDTLKLGEAVEAKCDVLRDFYHGVRMGVF